MDNQKATHLIIDRKKVSVLAAGFITLIATSFMIGYFKGYKNNLENKKIEVLKESLNDQAIFNLTLATHDKIQEVNLEPVLLADLEEAQNLEIKTLPNIKLPEDLTVKKPETNSNQISNKKAYAQLVGYGNKKIAKEFFNKLKNKGYPVIFKERAGSNNKLWYQIVTEVMPKNELIILNKKLTNAEKIKPVILELEN